MSILKKILQVCRSLEAEGHTTEAGTLKRVLASYLKNESDDVPLFFRRNYDYGEGFYSGNMSEKDSVKDFLDKHHKKGPNWKKKSRGAK